MADNRIKYDREDLVKKFLEVETPQAALTKAFDKHPLCHILSMYTIRPVACDQFPFKIHHKNKQPVLLAQKKPRQRNDQGREVDNLDSGDEKEEQSDDDDEFETVTADKKRGQKKQSQIVDEQPTFDPRFPASDPSKVKVITVLQKDKPRKEKPIKEGDKNQSGVSTKSLNASQPTTETAKEANQSEPSAEKKDEVVKKKGKGAAAKVPDPVKEAQLKEQAKKKEIAQKEKLKIADMFLEDLGRPKKQEPVKKVEEAKVEEVKVEQPKVEEKVKKEKEVVKKEKEVVKKEKEVVKKDNEVTKKEKEPVKKVKEPVKKEKVSEVVEQPISEKKRPQTAKQEQPQVQKKSQPADQDKKDNQGVNEIFMAMMLAEQKSSAVEEKVEEAPKRPQTAQPNRGRGERGRGRGRGQRGDRGGAAVESREEQIPVKKNKANEAASKPKGPSLDDVVNPSPRQKKPAEKKPLGKQEEQKQQDKPMTNIEDVLKAQDKETQKKKKVEKDKGVKESFDPNDFMAAMSRGAEMSQAQATEKKFQKNQKLPGEPTQRGRGRGGNKKTDYPAQKSGLAGIYDK